MMTITKAHCGSVYQSGEPMPTARSTADSTPKFGSNTNSHSRPTATPDSTYGATTMVRAAPRKRSLRLSSTASSRPSTIPPPTVARVKIAVTASMRGVPGSAKKSA
jgi:hypothetical protein